jgi:predicted enzyme related to lactoylglutathione lyase
MIDHFNAYAIPVRDLEKCVSFYRDKAGLKLQHREDDMAYFVFSKQERPGVALVTMESAVNLISESRVRPKEETIDRTYFAVFVDDVDKEYDDLRSKGGCISSSRRRLTPGDRGSPISKTLRGICGKSPPSSKSD